MKKAIDYIGVSAGAMIFSDEGELFLSKRSQNCKNERGHWETPGGSVEFGETLEQAARREIKEEYGADIDITEQFPAADHLIPKEKQHWVATTFLATFRPGQTPRIMEPDKCDEIGWFPLDKLPRPLSIITQSDLEEYTKRTAQPKKPQVGVGVMILKDNKVLLAKRKGSHGAGEYAFPGGHLEFGESFEDCAIRETNEETGIKIGNIKFQYLANVTKYKGKHYVHIGVTANWVSGEPEVLEPDKSESWRWYPLDQVPQPLFEMCRMSLESYQTGQTLYLGQ